MDVRTCLSQVLNVADKTTDKALQKFITGEFEVYEVRDEIQSTGKTDDPYKFLHSFRTKICDNNIFNNIVQNDNSNIDFELDKIQKQIDRLINKRK